MGRVGSFGLIIRLLLTDDILVGVELPLGLADLLLQLRKGRFQVRNRRAILLSSLILELPTKMLDHLNVHRVPRLSLQVQTLAIDVWSRGLSGQGFANEFRGKDGDRLTEMRRWGVLVGQAKIICFHCIIT